MPRWVIHTLNAAWLVIVLIGVPSITSRTFGDWAVASHSDHRILTLWGLGLGAVANLAVSYFVKGKKNQTLCQAWAAIIGGLFVLEFLLFRRQIHFNWLADFLKWVQGLLRP